MGLGGLIARLGVGMQADDRMAEAASLAPGRDEIAAAWAGGERLPSLVAEDRYTGTRLSGDQLARRLGEGLDFEQLRAYQPGEPAARIDWRVSARLDEPVVRVHREPAQRQAHMVIDCGAAMRFGTRRRLKLTQGLLAAHAFAAGALRQGLAVEMHPVGEMSCPGHHVGGAITGQAAILQRLAEMAGAAGASGAADRNLSPPDWPGLRQRLAQRLPPGSVIVVLSDCLADTGPGRAIDWAPLAAHQHLIFVSISDRVELDMPDMGLAAFESGEGLRWLDTGSQRWRELFSQGQRAALREWREAAESLGSAFLPLAADAEPADWLPEVPIALARAAGVTA